jgi:polyketide synthase 12
MSQLHIRVLLGQMDLGPADLDVLAVQLNAALDGPLLLYLSADDLAEPAPRIAERIAACWQDLIRRTCRP